MGRGAATEVVEAAPRRRGRPTLWTDERIEAKLREVIEEIGDVPAMAELRRRGLGGMAKAIGRKGIAFHAGRVGLGGIAPLPEVSATPPQRQAKESLSPRKWTDERVKLELRRLVDENGGRFPTRVKLEAQGLHGLRAAVKRKGIAHWARRLGVELTAGQDREPYGLEQARRDIERVVAETGRLPGAATLRKLGYPRLASLITRFGGTTRFCAAHRIELPA